MSLSIKPKFIRFLILLFSINFLVLASLHLHASSIEKSKVNSDGVMITQTKVKSAYRKDIEEQYFQANRKSQARVTIFMYHHIGKDPKPSKYSYLTYIDEEVFRRQIQYLKEKGYNTITVKELIDVFDGKLKLPPKPVILTFDDGYVEHFEKAYKTLEQHDMKATVYVPTYILNYPTDYWLKAGQIQEMANFGIEIGSHSVNHVYLNEVGTSQIKFETFVSKRQLETITGKEIVTFSYPGCLYDKGVIEITKQAGYIGAVACSWGKLQKESERYFLHRYVATDDFERFKSILEQ